MSDITVSPRPSGKENKRKKKKRKKRIEVIRTQVDEVKDGDWEAAKGYDEAHNHRWRDGNIPEGNVKKVERVEPQPPPFHSSVQVKLYQKQQEEGRRRSRGEIRAEGMGGGGLKFEAPNFTDTGSQMNALQQLLACHPKMPSDSLMQRELQLVGLQQLVNDLLDSDSTADVGDLLVILEDESKKRKVKGKQLEADEEDMTGRRVQKVSVSEVAKSCLYFHS